MFKSGSIENELMQSMKKQLVSNNIETKRNFKKIAKALDYLNAAAYIFDIAGMHAEAQEVTDVLQSMTDQSWEDETPGGLADNKKPSDFDQEALAKGAKVEQEHTNDPHLAKEIAMDHLTEDPKYYDKLEKMEDKKSSVNDSYSIHFVKQALSLEQVSDVAGKLNEMKGFDITSEDLKNLFWSSPIGMQVALVNKLYELFKGTKNEGLVKTIKDQLKEIDVTDPDKLQEIKDSISSKMGTLMKALRIAEMFA